MIAKTVDIPTSDGQCDTYIAYPEGAKDLPAVLFYMDAIGIRPRIYEMANRLASHGYFVMAPNIFYRTSRAPVFDYESMFKAENRDDMFRKYIMPVAMQLKVDMAKRDAEAFLNYFKTQSDVALSKKIGATGYCLGGGQALRACGNFPDSFAAVASFHAGALATDSENSPHHFFKNTKAEIYIGHADHDSSMPPEQMERVSQVLRENHIKFEAELYKDCRHGWTMSDMPVYNKEGEEKHWRKLLALFARTLKK